MVKDGMRCVQPSATECTRSVTSEGFHNLVLNTPDCVQYSVTADLLVCRCAEFRTTDKHIRDDSGSPVHQLGSPRV